MHISPLFVAAALAACFHTIPLGAQQRHTIAAGETLYGVARQHGITTDALCAANAGLSAEHFAVGQSVVIPVPKQTVTMAVALPFGVGDTRSQHVLEFYRGALMAADDFRKGGTDVVVHGVEAGTTASDARFVMSRHPELAKADFVIAPQPDEQMDEWVAFSQKNGVMLVAPWWQRGAARASHGGVWLTAVQHDDEMHDLASVIATVLPRTSAVVVAHVAGEDSERTSRLTAVAQAIAPKGSKVHHLPDGASAEEAIAALTGTKGTAVVICTARGREDVRRVTSLLQQVQAALPKCNISALGDSQWLEWSAELSRAYHALDTHVWGAALRSEGGRTIAFEGRYREWAGRSMSPLSPRWGTMGYDVAWHFLQMVGGARSDAHPMEHRMTMQRVSANGGWVNNASMMMKHYKRDGGVEMIERK